MNIVQLNNEIQKLGGRKIIVEKVRFNDLMHHKFINREPDWYKLKADASNIVRFDAIMSSREKYMLNIYIYDHIEGFIPSLNDYLYLIRCCFNKSLHFSDAITFITSLMTNFKREKDAF